MIEPMLEILTFLGLAYWVEVLTDSPQCTYYFGPFLNKQEAIAASSGYLEDLQGEGAQITSVIVKRCKPSHLTICDDREDRQQFPSLPRLSRHKMADFRL